MKTYSLSEVAAMVLPPEWTDAERWLRRRLNHGQIVGYQVSRGVWRMTEKQLDEFVEKFTNAASQAVLPQRNPAASVVDGLSQRSRRRLRRAS